MVGLAEARTHPTNLPAPQIPKSPRKDRHMSHAQRLHTDLSRRRFLHRSGGLLAGAALAGSLSARAYAGEDNTIRVALVGCGGRGTGAAAQALSTKGPTKLWAMADFFDNRLQSSLRNLSGQFAPQIEVPKERQFTGLDAYRKAIDALRPGDVVLLATPPGFRPIHLEYAVAQGRHVFMEKSFAVDAPGVRRVMKAGEEATKKNLKIAGGLMSRHYKPLEDAVQKIHDGAIGKVITLWAYREHGPVGFTPKDPGRNRAGAPDSQLLELHLAQRQLPAGLADPQSRRVLLDQGFLAGLGPGPGGPPGPHPARSVVRPVRGGIHVCRRHAAFCPGPAHAEHLGLLRRHRARGHGLGRPGRRTVAAPPLQRSPANARQPALGLQGAGLQPLPGRARPAVRRHPPGQTLQRDRRCAAAAMTGILGRMAAESGQAVTWEQALASKLELAPGLDQCTMDSPAPVMPDAQGRYPVAMPGMTKVL